jgi:hypothetical protein
MFLPLWWKEGVDMEKLRKALTASVEKLVLLLLQIDSVWL